MIQNSNAYQVAGLFYLFRYGSVFWGWVRNSGWVVMHHQDGGGRRHNGAFDNLTGINSALANSPGLDTDSDKLVFLIKKQEQHFFLVIIREAFRELGHAYWVAERFPGIRKLWLCDSDCLKAVGVGFHV
jgi:hypothetical protein